MDTFLTMLIWLGSGFALAIGFFAGMIVMMFALRTQTKTEQMSAESIALLRERNNIGVRQAIALERIADKKNET